MEIIKNYYYEATLGGKDLELAVRSDFKGNFNVEDFCICQSRIREDNKTITRYHVLSPKELRLALKLPPRAKLEIRG